jgi:hypothetical protein
MQMKEKTMTDITSVPLNKLTAWEGMEYIEGEDIKLRAIADRFAHINEAERECHRAGIRHTTDASAFFAADPRKFKLIDFAVEAFPPSW